MFYWDKPQFYGVKTQASNVAQSRGDYTADMFKEDFPQFFDTYGVCLLPDTIQKEFISQASAVIQPDRVTHTWTNDDHTMEFETLAI